jgi:osmotically-inducible protein OsmY
MKTNEQLQQDVIAELNWEPSIDATQIGVAAKDGIVTLTGHVSGYAEKELTSR